MDQGNTGFHVAPLPTESEMEQAKSVLTRAADALVTHSTLQASFDTLKAQVDAFSRDLEASRNTNRYLDEQIVTLRDQRDTCQRQANEAQTQANNALQARDAAEQDVTILRDENRRLHDQVTNTMRDRDEAITHSLENEAQLEAVRTKLDLILGHARDLLAEEDRAKNVPQAPQAWSNPTPTPAAAYSPEYPQATAVPEKDWTDPNKPW